MKLQRDAAGWGLYIILPSGPHHPARGVAFTLSDPCELDVHAAMCMAWVRQRPYLTAETKELM